MSADWLIWAALFIAIPIGIGLLMGASWSAIVAAGAILAALCCLFGFPVGDDWDQRLMWAVIYWMVGCIPGIPLIIFLLRLVGLR